MSPAQFIKLCYEFNVAIFSGGTPGTGTVTSVATGTGLTGGTITTTGTIEFADAADQTFLGNVSGAAAPPIPLALTRLLQASNNLSDLASLPLSRLNLVVPATSTVAGNPTGTLGGHIGDFAVDISDGNILYMCTATGSSSTAVWTLQGGGTTPATFVTVAAATIGNFASSYNNGSSGVGATLTATATGVVSFDTIATVLNGVYLIKNQTSTLQNGLYLCTTAGAVGVSGVFTRLTAYDSAAELNSNVVVRVSVTGGTQAGTAWSQSSTVTTVGSDVISYGIVGNVKSITQGVGITVTLNAATGVATVGLTAPVSIANGGTGGTTNTTARSNLSVPLADFTSSATYTPNGVTVATRTGDLALTQFPTASVGGRHLWFVPVTSSPNTNNWQLLGNQYADLVYLNGALAGTYANGSAVGITTGTGATLTDNSGTFAPLVADGVTATVGMLILLPFNGISGGLYYLTTQGNGTSVPWLLTRYLDFDNGAKLVPGAAIIVMGGNTQIGKIYGLTVKGVGSTVGTTSITFSNPETIRFDASGNAIGFSGAADQSKTVITPTTGSTVVLATIHRSTIINTAVLAALTVNMPASPIDGQLQTVSSVGGVTTLTVGSAGSDTITGAPSNIRPTGGFTMVYHLASTTWFPYIGGGNVSGGGGGSPAGSTNDIQFNVAGSFAADTGNFGWDSTNHNLNAGLGASIGAGAQNAFALGNTAIALNIDCFAFGNAASAGTLASGTNHTGAVAIGMTAIASGQNALALGSDTTASGSHALAMTEGASASGNFSVAIGNNTAATASGAWALGASNIVSHVDAWVLAENSLGGLSSSKASQLKMGFSGGGLFQYSAAGIAFEFDNVGNFINHAGEADASKLIVTPTTGSTVTLATINRRTIINTGLLAALTLNMPATPVDGQLQTVSSVGGVTALTVASAGSDTIVGAPSTIVASSSFTMEYDLTSTSWYPA